MPVILPSLNTYAIMYLTQDFFRANLEALPKPFSTILSTRARSMPTTIQDISRKLGVSVSTVSKALNNYPDVAHETRGRVLAAARELDYHPNAAAQNLRRQRTNKLGLIYNYSFTAVGEFVNQLLTGAASAAEEAGYNLVLYSSVSDSPEQLATICRAREVDGLLIIWSNMPAKTLEMLEAEGIRYVSVARRVDKHPAVSYVVADNYAGSLALTRHLIAEGHRRIAFLAMPMLFETSEDRQAGYEAALREAGIAVDPTLIRETTVEPKTRRVAVTTLLDLPNPPTAIFAFHDYGAIDTLQVATERGLRVPEDLAIAGFDGMYSAMVTSPPLTTVQQPVKEIGWCAVEILLHQINDPTTPARRLTLPAELIVRASTRSGTS